MNVATHTNKLGLVIVLCFQSYPRLTCYLMETLQLWFLIMRKELCLHFIKFLETNGIGLFLTLNTQWPAVERISRV